MQALLICLTAGLIWQFVLVAILIRRELGGLEWPRVRNALWLRAPRDPKTRHVGGRIWLWVLPFVVLFGLEGPGSPRTLGEGLRRLPGLGPRPGLLQRGVGLVRGRRPARRVQHRARRGAALRGLLLPRMQGVRAGRLGRQRGAVRGLPPAHAVGDPHHPDRHLRPGLSIAAVPERLDGDRRALGSERHRPWRHPGPRTGVVRYPKSIHRSVVIGGPARGGRFRGRKVTQDGPAISPVARRRADLGRVALVAPRTAPISKPARGRFSLCVVVKNESATYRT